MITLISGTNRPNSNTLKVAKTYSSVLSEIGAAHQLLSLEDLPKDFAFAYFPDSQSSAFRTLTDTFIRQAGKFIIVIPEYNGTFPGIFKLFLDSLHPNELKGKKVAIAGVSTGRGGNLRGIDHLTGAFHYLGMTVYPGHLPISRLRELQDADGNLADEVVLRAMKMQGEGFMNF